MDVQALMEEFDGCGGAVPQRDLTADEHYAVAVEELRYANELDSRAVFLRGRRIRVVMARAQIHATLAAAGGAR